MRDVRSVLFAIEAFKILGPALPTVTAPQGGTTRWRGIGRAAIPLTRKEFLVLIAGAAAARCGGGSSAGNCLADGTTVRFNENHGHVLVVTNEDVAAGVSKTFDIRGTADHTHLVTLTASDMLSLQKNGQAVETSTLDGSVPHTHTATITCA